MKNIGFSLFVVFFVSLLNMQAWGAIISGGHLLSDGRYVNLQGLDWLSIDATMGSPREFVLSGVGYEGYNDWRFATREETENLLDSLWGGIIENWDISNFVGADWFVQNFGADVGSGGYQYWSSFYYGSDSDVAAVSGFGDTLKGSVYCNYDVDWFPDEFAFDSGHFTDKDGLSAGASPGNVAIRTTSGEPLSGYLLVRNTTPLPEANSLVLMTLGILMLFSAKRRFS